MQTDTWWQLRAGRDMWLSGRVLLTDTFSHTASGTFWVNHEWLAEVIFYALHRYGGFPLLTLFSAVMIAAGWMFTWRLTRGPSRVAFVLTVLALISSAGWWEPRPHAFSLLFIPWMAFLLYREKVQWLPALFLVWANCHGGVLLGLVLLGAGLAAQTFVKPSTWRRSLVVLVGCAAAMTVTPLGVHFWVEIPRSLSRISQYTLDEWLPPSLVEPIYLPFWGIAAAYLLALGRSLPRLRQVAPSEAALHALALVLLPGAATAVRNVGPFLMVAIPALTHLWASAGSRAGAIQPDARKDKHAFNLAVMVLSAVGVAYVLAAAYRQPWPRLKWNPVSTASLAALNQCPGNLYNRYDEGGMLTWFAPDRKVFLDGRQDPFPLPMVLEHIEMETGKRDHRDVFSKYDIQCAFLPPSSPVTAGLVAEGWRELHRDARWVVLAR